MGSGELAAGAGVSKQIENPLGGAQMKWTETLDATSGRNYYVNTQTQETTWSKPVDFDGPRFSGLPQAAVHVPADLVEAVAADLEDIDEEPVKFCSLRNPMFVNVLSSIIVVPMIILFFLKTSAVLNFLVEYRNEFSVVGAFMKLLSKLVYSFAVLPIGTLYKFVLAMLPVNIWLAAFLYNIISAVVEALAFAFHRKFSQLPEGSAKADETMKAGSVIERMRQGQKAAVDSQADRKPWQKVVEIFCVQNAFGVPDTGTMLFYALCTDYPLWIFASATLMSYMSVGMVKQVAWMAALRSFQAVAGGLSESCTETCALEAETCTSVAVDLAACAAVTALGDGTACDAIRTLGADGAQGAKVCTYDSGGWDLSKINRDMSPSEEWTIRIVGVFGMFFIIYKVVTITKGCFSKKKPADDAEGAATAGGATPETTPRPATPVAWLERFNMEHKRPLFVHSVTGETAWEKPAGFTQETSPKTWEMPAASFEAEARRSPAQPRGAPPDAAARRSRRFVAASMVPDPRTLKAALPDARVSSAMTGDDGKPKAQAVASLELTTDGLFDAVDEDGSGAISFKEFKRWWMVRRAVTGQGSSSDVSFSNVAELFTELDVDKSGYLGREEFKAVIETVAHSEWHEIKDEGSGRVYYVNQSGKSQWVPPGDAEVESWLAERIK